jgi:hypothetical protein
MSGVGTPWTLPRSAKKATVETLFFQSELQEEEILSIFWQAC